MKKSIIIFVLFSFSLIAQAQVWIDQGAIWHYKYSGLVSGGFVKINYTKDTIIANRNCQQLVPVKYVFFADSNHVVFFGGAFSLNPEYTSVSGDTVFYLLNNQFQVLYNFNVQPGDSWDLGVDTNFFKCSKSTVRVDSVGIITINNHNYRWIYVNSLPNSSKILQGRIIERFGSASGYLFPVDNFCDSNIAVDADYMSFLCYKDTTFTQYNPTNSSCEPYLNIVSSKLADLYLNIYPNPANDVIFISQTGYKISAIKVFNPQGQQVITKPVKPNENTLTIAINTLSKGIYFLQLNTDIGIVSKKFIVYR